MMQFIERSFVMDAVGWDMLVMFGVLSFFIVAYAFENTMLAIVFTPVMTISAAMGQHALRELGVVASYDKTVNTGIGMSAGLLCGAFVVIFAIWAFNAMRA